MKDRIIFTSPTTTHGSGGAITTYSNVLTTWAEVKQITQSRALQYGIVENFRSYEIMIRYREDVTLSTINLISFKNKSLTIHSIIEDRKKSFKIIAYENA